MALLAPDLRAADSQLWGPTGLCWAAGVAGWGRKASVPQALPGTGPPLSVPVLCFPGAQEPLGMLARGAERAWPWQLPGREAWPCRVWSWGPPGPALGVREKLRQHRVGPLQAGVPALTHGTACAGLWGGRPAAAVVGWSLASTPAARPPGAAPGSRARSRLWPRRPRVTLLPTAGQPGPQARHSIWRSPGWSDSGSLTAALGGSVSVAWVLWATAA